jgi:RHS repeat-associated protein
MTPLPCATGHKEYSAAGILLASYVWGRGPISQSQGGTVSHFLLDGLGSVRLLLDAGASIVKQLRYDAYGLMKAESGSAITPYTYRGYRFDPVLGHFYLLARFYNPATARFSTMDPFPGSRLQPQSLHRYIYVNDDPINYVDPTGLFGEGIGGLLNNIGTVMRQFAMRMAQLYRTIESYSRIIKITEGFAFLAGAALAAVWLNNKVNGVRLGVAAPIISEVVTYFIGSPVGLGIQKAELGVFGNPDGTWTLSLRFDLWKFKIRRIPIETKLRFNFTFRGMEHLFWTVQGGFNVPLASVEIGELVLAKIDFAVRLGRSTNPREQWPFRIGFDATFFVYFKVQTTLWPLAADGGGDFVL